MRRLSHGAVCLLLSLAPSVAVAQPRQLPRALPRLPAVRRPAAAPRPPVRAEPANIDADPYAPTGEPPVAAPPATTPAAQPAEPPPPLTPPPLTPPAEPQTTPPPAQSEPAEPQTTPPPAQSEPAEPQPSQPPPSPTQPVVTPPAETPSQPPPSPPAPTPVPSPDAPELTLRAWAEAYYAFNFNTPANGINAYRIYDIQHDHIGFNNLAFDLNWKVSAVHGHTTLQLGALAAEAYYPATTLPRAQQELLWRLLQEVTFGWSPRLLGGRPLSVDVGLFVAPFGVEYVEIYKNWNWSPSNLFYIAPFQMTGARASWTFNDSLTLRAGVYSGWDRVIDDNNEARSFLFQAEWAATEKLFLNFEYMVGVERDRDAREGPWVRHTFDHWGELEISPRLQVRWHLFAGLEPNRFGTSGWLGVAAYARVKLFDWLFAATRVEVLHELVPRGTESLFALHDASTLGEGTLTVEALPDRHFSVRLEYRHDLANGSLFYRDALRIDRMTGDAITNAGSQDTLTVGATAWF